MKFCDVPALYNLAGSDVTEAYSCQQNPVAMPYKRLQTFGVDVRHIAQQYLDEPNLKSIEFQGRTGLIQISNPHIQRPPHCFENIRKGIRSL